MSLDSKQANDPPDVKDNLRLQTSKIFLISLQILTYIHTSYPLDLDSIYLPEDNNRAVVLIERDNHCSLIP